MRDLPGRTALVTGALGGVGRPICKALGERGVHLGLLDRDPQRLDELAADLRAGGLEAVAFPIDLADLEALTGLPGLLERRLGPVDILVNNAAVAINVGFHTLTPADLARTLRTNLLAPMVLANLLLPQMLGRGSGHIVMLSSLAGKMGPPYSGTYGATKAGLIGLTQTLRAEYRQRGVSASVICPGFISGAGMFARISEHTGVSVPLLIGTSTPEAVARAVVRAVERDLPEVIVNPMPSRPLFALAQLAPALGERLAAAMGANEIWKVAAATYELEPARDA